MQKKMILLLLPLLVAACASFFKNRDELEHDKFVDACTKGMGKPAPEVTRDLGQPYSDKQTTCGEVPWEEVEYYFPAGVVRLLFARHDDGSWRLVQCWTRHSALGDWTRFPFSPGA